MWNKVYWEALPMEGGVLVYAEHAPDGACACDVHYAQVPLLHSEGDRLPEVVEAIQAVIDKHRGGCPV